MRIETILATSQLKQQKSLECGPMPNLTVARVSSYDGSNVLVG